MTTQTRPEQRMLPEPTAESAAFWGGGERGALTIMRCHACGHFFHPPAPVCFRCRSLDVAPEATNGRAYVAAFTVNVQQWLPHFPPPYVIAIVELDEDRDVRLTTNIVDVDPRDVEVGMPVQVTFEQWGDDSGQVWIPVFVPAESPA